MSEPLQPVRPRPWCESGAAMGVVLLVATLIRLVGLGAHDFWYDEALEVARERLPWPRILFLIDGPDPPLYRLLQSPLARLTSSEAWLRLPSVAYSVAAIALVWCWLARLGDRRLALVTATLLAIAPVQVHYAQEVSQYALATLMSAWLLLAAQRAIDLGRRRDWIVLGTAFVLAFSTYYGLVFLIAPLDLVLAAHAWRRGEARRWRGLVGANVALVAVAALLYHFMLAQQQARFAGDHLHPWLGTLSPGATLARIAADLQHEAMRFFWFSWSEPPRALMLVPGVLGAIGAVVLALRGPRWWSPLACLGLGLVLMTLADGLGAYPFGYRHALFLSPLLFVIVAAGLLRVARGRIAGAVAGTLVAASLLAFLPNVAIVPYPWRDVPREDLAQVLDWVATRARGDESIYLYYGALPAFRLYESRATLPVVRGAPFRARTPADKVASVRAAMAERARFFLVASHVYGDEREQLVGGLVADGGYHVVATHDESGAFAVLLERTTTDPNGSTTATSTMLD